MSLHVDYSRRIVVATHDLDYTPAPSAGVWRKRLEHLGPPEAGRVTSLVRYDPGASFPAHDHPDGEEILVLEGEWCDDRGRFGEGTFQLNPEGFRHAPYTRSGCTLFVKLRQYAGPHRRTVLLNTLGSAWVEREIPGVSSIALYESPDYPESIRLTRMLPGTRAPTLSFPEGEEIFVLSGSFSDELGRYQRHTWLRLPPGSQHTPVSDDGCVLYVKRGGFPRHSES